MTACRPARRVRKFGRRGFAGESCRSPVDVTSGSRARRRARDGRSTFSPDRLKRQRRPAVRLRPRGAEHLLGREPHSRPGARALAVIGHSEGTARSHWQKLTHPLEWLSAVRRYTNLRPKCRRPRFRISLEIVTTEFTNPTGRLIREDTRLALCRCGASANKPFCDGSHRRIGFTTAPAAAEEADKAGMPLQSESRALQAAESADRRSGGISWKEPIEGSRDE
jgi:CDGSH-type Zn-finger protein